MDRASSLLMQTSFLFVLIRSFSYRFIDVPHSLSAHSILHWFRVALSLNTTMSFSIFMHLVHGSPCFTKAMFLLSGVLQLYEAIKGLQTHNISETCTLNSRCKDKLSCCNIWCMEFCGMCSITSLLGLKYVASVESVGRLLLEGTNDFSSWKLTSFWLFDTFEADSGRISTRM